MKWGLNLTEKPNRTTAPCFLALSWVGIGVMFRGAITGQAILAPLDIPAKLFPHYHGIGPGGGKVGRSHYVIVVFDLDRPLSHWSHRSIHSDKFARLNPHCEGGRPLAMERH